MGCPERRNEDNYDPFACDRSPDDASTVDPSSVVFVGEAVTYARFFIRGVKFNTMDGRPHQATGMGNPNDPNSVYITINGVRTKLTNTKPRKGITIVNESEAHFT